MALQSQRNHIQTSLYSSFLSFWYVEISNTKREIFKYYFESDFQILFERCSRQLVPVSKQFHVVLGLLYML
jgi:hypothetical protein